MAIIGGKAPPSEPSRTNVRVVVKLAARRAASEGPHPNRDTALLGRLQAVAPRTAFKPYFADDAQLRAATLAPFNRYVAAEVADRTAATALARDLASMPEVEDAYVEGGPVPPPSIRPTIRAAATRGISTPPPRASTRAGPGR